MEDFLLNYGVLGIWTSFNLSTILYYRKKEAVTDNIMRTVIENNTVVMTRVYESMRACAAKGI